MMKDNMVGLMEIETTAAANVEIDNEFNLENANFEMAIELAAEAAEAEISKNTESTSLISLEQATKAREMAEAVVASRKKDKQFQIELQTKLGNESTELMKGMSEEAVLAYKKLMMAELTAADQRAEDAVSAEYMSKLTAEAPNKPVEYMLAKKLEYSIIEDDEKIMPQTRQEYVFWFKSHQRKSARATLEMCRTVYEAEKILRADVFASFCKDIGYEDNSSTIRKFTAIGKVYPRLIDYAEQMPTAWTSIYLLTQMPADDFERCIKDGYSFSKLSGGELKELIDKTKDINKMNSPFKQDKKMLAYPVAKIFFTKLPDDTDYRLLQKAFDEVCARLPVKVQLIGEQSKMFEERRKQRYEQLKQEVPSAAIQPQTWDFGTAANAVYDKMQDKQAA